MCEMSEYFAKSSRLMSQLKILLGSPGRLTLETRKLNLAVGHKFRDGTGFYIIAHIALGV